MKINIRKAMRTLWITLILGTVATGYRVNAQDYTETIKNIKMMKAVDQENLKMAQQANHSGLTALYKSQIKKWDVMLARYEKAPKNARISTVSNYNDATAYYYDFMTKRGDTINVADLPMDEFRTYLSEYNK